VRRRRRKHQSTPTTSHLGNNYLVAGTARGARYFAPSFRLSAHASPKDVDTSPNAGWCGRGSVLQGTKVRRYNWHSAGSLGWPFPMLKYEYIFSNKIYGSNFIKHHSEAVML